MIPVFFLHLGEIIDIAYIPPTKQADAAFWLSAAWSCCSSEGSFQDDLGWEYFFLHRARMVGLDVLLKLHDATLFQYL